MRSYSVTVTCWQAELEHEYNFIVPSRLRGATLLGRCHRAKGEHALAVASFDAAVELAKQTRNLLSEVMAVRDKRAAGGTAAPGGAGSHYWTEHEGRQRLTEVVGRMVIGADSEQAEALLRPPPAGKI